MKRNEADCLEYWEGAMYGMNSEAHFKHRRS